MKENVKVTDEPTSPPSAENPPSKQPIRLWLLLTAHVALGLFFSIWSAVEGAIAFVLMFLLVIPVFGFAFSQSALLGLWVAFSPARWWMRLGSLVVGIIYLEFLVGLGGTGEEFTGLAAMATGGIAAVFGLVRWRFADLHRFPEPAVQTGQEGLKFSIRGLMLFTFVVAITIVAVNELRENISVGPGFFAVSTWSLCFVTVGLAGVWAGLGLARPTLRSIVVLLVSAVLGTAFVYTVIQSSWEPYFYITTIMVLQAAVLIASLLVVRSCGYRLVRKSASSISH